MKIFHIVSRRFLTGLSSEYNLRLRAQLLNSELYVEESLTEEEIDNANNSDAVYTRGKLNQDLLNKLRVPVFIQHENPLLAYGEFSERAIYVTDNIYVPYFPKAEPMPQLILDEEPPATQKDFDVIFIGRARGWNGIVAKLLRVLLRGKINNFGSIFDVVSFGVSAWIYTALRMLLPTKTYMRILWHSTNVIRGLRREIILDELRKLAGEGVRVAVVGDKDVLKKIGQHPNIQFYGVSEWKVVKDLMVRSIFTVATTPLHQSIIDGRYFEALQCRSIPLYEPYPQYSCFAPADSTLFTFDYSENPLGKLIKDLLGNLNTVDQAYERIRTEALRAHGKEKYIIGYRTLVDKYK